MPLPDPLCLAGAEQATLDPDGRQQLGVPLRGGQTLAEQLLSCRTKTFGELPRHVSVGQYDDAPLRLLAFALAVHAVHGSHRVVHHLALERRHRGQSLRLAAGGDAGGCGGAEGCQLHPTPGPIAGHVAHQAATYARSLLDRQSGEVLECLQGGTPFPDEDVQTLAHDRYGRPAALDVEIQIAVEVENVQQFLEVVRGVFPLLLEVAHVRLAADGRRRRRLIRLYGVGLVGRLNGVGRQLGAGRIGRVGHRSGAPEDGSACRTVGLHQPNADVTGTGSQPEPTKGGLATAAAARTTFAPTLLRTGSRGGSSWRCLRRLHAAGAVTAV